MNVVDSSGWLEYFCDGPNAAEFVVPILETDQLIVPVITIYEVFKHICLRRGEEEGLRAVAVMSLGKVIDLTQDIALEAAAISIENKIPMADSLILSTARAWQATLWTQDEHFQGLENVQFIACS